MNKEPTEKESSIGVTLSGTPEEGQRVELATEKALQTIFGDKASRNGQCLVGVTASRSSSRTSAAMNMAAMTNAVL